MTSKSCVYRLLIAYSKFVTVPNFQFLNKTKLVENRHNRQRVEKCYIFAVQFLILKGLNILIACNVNDHDYTARAILHERGNTLMTNFPGSDDGIIPCLVITVSRAICPCSTSRPYSTLRHEIWRG